MTVRRNRSTAWWLRFSIAAVSGTILALTTGCVGLLAHVGLWTGGNFTPAEFAGLEGQRVAVICVSDSSSYGSGAEADHLARGIQSLLSENIEKIDLVRHDEIADWIDKNDWNEIDYREVGRGVKADKVLAVDLSGFRLYEAQTLYRGHANVAFTVYDMKANGREVFRRQLPEIKFPANGVYHASETSEAQFRRMFLSVVARNIARHFHKYESMDIFGGDPASLE